MSDKTYVLNGVLPAPVKDGNNITPAGPIQLLFTNGERETALGIAQVWYEKGYKPYLYSKTYDGQFEHLFNYRFKDRGKKIAATKKTKKAA